MDYSIIWACLAALLAGFVDAIVGGGGLVQVPALFILFPQFEVARIIGTNRFSSFMGTGVAAYQYSKATPIPWKTVLFTSLGAAVFSYLGAITSSLIRPEVLKPIVLILMISIAFYTYSKKTLGQSDDFKIMMTTIPVYGFFVGVVTGFYNGFIGPGTGSLLVFGFVSLIGFSFLKGSAIAKFVNVVADVASLVFLLMNGFVEFKIAIPMMFCNMIGSYLGSKTAILRGNEFVRKFFIGVISALILRFAYDIFKTF